MKILKTKKIFYFIVSLLLLGFNALSQDSLLITANPEQYAIFETHDGNLMVVSKNDSVLNVTKRTLTGSTIFQVQHPYNYSLGPSNKDNLVFNGKKNFFNNGELVDHSNSIKVFNTFMINETGNILWQNLDTATNPQFNFHFKGYFKQSDSTFLKRNLFLTYIADYDILDVSGNVLSNTAIDTFGYGGINTIVRADGSFLSFYNYSSGFKSIKHLADGTFDNSWDQSVHEYAAPYNAPPNFLHLRFYDVATHGNHYRIVGEYLGEVIFLDVDTNGQLISFNAKTISFNGFGTQLYTAGYDNDYYYVISRYGNNFVLSVLNNDFEILCQKAMPELIANKGIVKLLGGNYLAVKKGDNQVLYAQLDGCSGDLVGFNEKDLVSNLNVYPNPSADYITVNSENNFINRIDIIDFAGRSIQTNSYHAINITLDISKLNSGFYTLKIQTEQGLRTSRIVKIGQ